MEFKFRAGEYPPPSYFPHLPPTDDYVTAQALRDGYINNDFHLRMTEPLPHDAMMIRELQKERIREEIIAREMFRWRELEEEVRKELAMDREIELRRKADRFSLASSANLPERRGVGLLSSEREIRPLIPEFGKGKVVFLGKSPKTMPNLVVTKRTAVASSEPKEWGCALCQVSATSEQGLNDHFRGKKHKAKEEELRGSKPGGENQSVPDPKKATSLAVKKVVVASNEQSPRHAMKPLASKQPADQSTLKNLIGVVKKGKFNFVCKDCQIKCDSELMIVAHLGGKKHMARMWELESARRGCTTAIAAPSKSLGKADAGGVVGTKKEVKIEGEFCDKVKEQKEVEETAGAEVKKGKFNFVCKDCQIKCNSKHMMEAHLGGKKHIARMMRELEAAGKGAATARAVPLMGFGKVDAGGAVGVKIEGEFAEEVKEQEDGEETTACLKGLGKSDAEVAVGAKMEVKIEGEFGEEVKEQQEAEETTRPEVKKGKHTARLMWELEAAGRGGAPDRAAALKGFGKVDAGGGVGAKKEVKIEGEFGEEVKKQQDGEETIAPLKGLGKADAGGAVVGANKEVKIEGEFGEEVKEQQDNEVTTAPLKGLGKKKRRKIKKEEEEKERKEKQEVKIEGEFVVEVKEQQDGEETTASLKGLGKADAGGAVGAKKEVTIEGEFGEEVKEQQDSEETTAPLKGLGNKKRRKIKKEEENERKEKQEVKIEGEFGVEVKEQQDGEETTASLKGLGKADAGGAVGTKKEVKIEGEFCEVVEEQQEGEETTGVEAKKGKLTFLCEGCQIKCYSELTMEAHLGGKKHMVRMMKEMEAAGRGDTTARATPSKGIGKFDAEGAVGAKKEVKIEGEFCEEVKEQQGGEETTAPLKGLGKKKRRKKKKEDKEKERKENQEVKTEGEFGEEVKGQQEGEVTAVVEVSGSLMNEEPEVTEAPTDEEEVAMEDPLSIMMWKWLRLARLE